MMKIETVAVGEFQVNCYVLVGRENQALVVDPGGNPERIVEALDRHNATVSVYLLTHGHMDHVSGLAALWTERPAPVALHPQDAAWAFTEANTMLPFYGVPAAPADGIARDLAAGQKWNDAGLAYSVIETPGHTPGSVSFYFSAEKALLCGDTLFAGSVGRTDLPGGNPRTLTRSLKKLAALPDDTRVLSGHGSETSIGVEKRNNYFMQGL